MRAQHRSLLGALIGFFFQCEAAFCTVVVQFVINSSTFRADLAHFRNSFRHEKSTMQICTVLYFGFMVEPRGIEDTLVCTPSSRSASERHRRSDQMGSISLCFVPLIKNPPLEGGFFIGGAEGNRTHFQKPINRDFPKLFSVSVSSLISTSAKSASSNDDGFHFFVTRLFLFCCCFPPL